MTFPGVIQVGDFSVRLAGVFHLASALAALAAYLWVVRRRGVPLRITLDATFALAVGAWLGAWLANAVLAEPDRPGVWAHLQVAGQSSLGALAGAVLAVALRAKSRAVPTELRHSLLDALVPALALGESGARVGCFLNGCCHGRPGGDFPWAVTFPVESACLYRGVPVHPTQLYLALPLALIGLALLGAAGRAGRFAGGWLSVYLTGYGTLRFLVEGLRGDWQDVWLGLRMNQWAALAMVLLGTLALLHRWRRGSSITGAAPSASSAAQPLLPNS